MSTERFVTRKEAARLCRWSVDTVRRNQGAGDYPNARLEENTWMIPVSDLVAAGHLDPTAPVESAPAGPDTSVTDTLRIAHLEAELARAESEIEFQRGLLMQLAAHRSEVA